MKSGTRNARRNKRRVKQTEQEAERREEIVQHEANYSPREEDADLAVARKHKSR